ncbi:cell envelope biogenesis protein TolA [Pseudogemmobacter bohemicus]|uniref:cell envelope biogenesis protein TolA n=1 Tax=Pseudogemmobacter bohemicus TaxID=2250708 RepID=UPI0013008586|nr:cell envelope biogenesis protein TolA [Pseudogemmobacter bohemicus]
MEGRFKTGTILSGAGHAGLILWVMLGDWLFSPSKPPEQMSMTVSTVSSAEFAAMEAAAANATEPSPDPAETISAPDPVEPSVDAPIPEPAPEPEPEPVQEPQPEPEPTPPPPTPEPEPTPEPVIENPAPPEAVFAPEEQAIPTMSSSIRPKPRPANIVAPNPAPVPEDTPTSDAPQEAVTPAEEPTPEPPREEQTATAPQDTGDVLLTEENAQDRPEESLGMQTSPRPKPRPNRPAPTPEPAAETQEERDARIAAEVAAEDRATQEAEARARREAQARAEEEAAAAAAAAAAASAGSGGQGQAASGPPLSGSEMGNISSAIGSKWNVGTMGTEAMSTVIVVRVTFDQAGKPTGMNLLAGESTGPSQQAIDVAFRNARSAITRAYTEGGIPLPADKYETWKVLDLVFDANGMRLR